MTIAEPLSAAESAELRSAVRAALEPGADECARRLLDAPDDPTHLVAVRIRWEKSCSELGLGALMLPVELGGPGLGVDGLAVVAEAAGAALTAVPLLGTAVLAGSLAAAYDGLPVVEIASGGTTVAVALPAVGSVTPDPAHQVTATVAGTEALLDGGAEVVVDGADADLVLVAATVGTGHVLVSVDPATPGVRRERAVTVDPTRPVARLRFDAARAEVVLTGEAATAAIDTAVALGHLALAADATGAAGRALDLTLDHVRQRVQFGRPIGSFQAVAHRCAELFVQLQTARSAVLAAVLAARADGTGSAGFHRTCAAAKAVAGRLGRQITDEAIHLHGGIGFTWEHPMHLLHRRTSADELLLGAPGRLHTAIFASLRAGRAAALPERQAV
jgi:alkylation response protein AidB-like acyl-CoA dehydrogenase